MKYDPDQAPDAQAWLRLDEDEALHLVESYHKRSRIRLPDAALHAVFHVTVENQIASGEATVITTLKRLQREGLSRHDAIHAIGFVLAAHMHDLVSNDVPPAGDPHEAYFAELRRLTVERWHRQAEEP
ncbi:MAG TPA: hypothetical protein VMM79_13725 [Longimicrobiales bacterium]|nr:hypothetical protein [Longimicrobiales bacterium]